MIIIILRFNGQTVKDIKQSHCLSNKSLMRISAPWLLALAVVINELTRQLSLTLPHLTTLLKAHEQLVTLTALFHYLIQIFSFVRKWPDTV